jgi:hypothetical protein
MSSSTSLLISNQFQQIFQDHFSSEILYYIYKKLIFGSWNYNMDFTLIVSFHNRVGMKPYNKYVVQLNSLSIFTDLLTLREYCIKEIKNNASYCFESIVLFEEPECNIDQFRIHSINELHFPCSLPQYNYFFIDYVHKYYLKKSLPYSS